MLIYAYDNGESWYVLCSGALSDSYKVGSLATLNPHPIRGPQIFPYTMPDTTASNQLPNLDDGSIEWKTFTKDDGTTYQVGTRKREGGARPEGARVAKEQSEPSNFRGIAVDWHLAPNDDWKEATKEVKDTVSISRYYLMRLAGGLYHYELGFTNTRHWDFHFWDSVPGSTPYQVDTYWNRDHWVRFKSDNPNISYITAE